jgi:hypothetical protein
MAGSFQCIGWIQAWGGDDLEEEVGMIPRKSPYA